MRNTTFTINPLETDLIDERPNDGYPSLLDYIRNSWNEAVLSKDPIFTTDAENLYDIFLNNIPEEARQHYTCRACRDFVNRYGGLVTIDKDGVVTPAMLVADYICPDFFMAAVNEMIRAVYDAKITGVFITPLKKLGIPKTGVWEHMAVEVPRAMRWKDRIKTANQRMAELKQDHETLWNALRKYSAETVKSAINLMMGDSLYRADKIRPQAQWFLDIINTKNTNASNYRHIIWNRVATAPAGFCHIPGSTLGSLLDDIQEGMDFETVKNRFNAKMNPLRYQRPQAAPTSQNVLRAEKIVAELGLGNSLRRRYARLEELQTIWTPRIDIPKIPTGIFSRVKTKDTTKTQPANNLVAPPTTMTWEKFQRTIMPTAKKIEYYVKSYDYGPYAAIVTAADMDAPPIVAWDKEDARNPFSWYLYATGSQGSSWNLNSGWVEVSAITDWPNLWTPGNEHHGRGVFFILKGCRDKRAAGLCLFPEILRGDLREVRATIEAYSKDGEMEGADEATACGVMLSANSHHLNLGKFRVTTDLGVHEYVLDRWD